VSGSLRQVAVEYPRRIRLQLAARERPEIPRGSGSRASGSRNNLASAKHGHACGCHLAQ
jgi:hypothetical protein